MINCVFIGYPPNASGYPPQNYPNNSSNRNSYPGYNAYPPQNYSGGFPEPQHFSGGYVPHSDNIGTPFAAHQGAFPNQPYPPAHNTGYPPQQGGYPPNNYPPY